MRRGQVQHVFTQFRDWLWLLGCLVSAESLSAVARLLAPGVDLAAPATKEASPLNGTLLCKTPPWTGRFKPQPLYIDNAT